MPATVRGEPALAARFPDTAQDEHPGHFEQPPATISPSSTSRVRDWLEYPIGNRTMPTQAAIGNNRYPASATDGNGAASVSNS